MLISWVTSATELGLVPLDMLRNVVSEMIRAYRRGHHLVTISRPIVDSLLSIGDWSALEIAALSKIRQEFSQFGNTHESATCYINVVTSLSNQIRRDGKRIDISMGALANSRVFETPRLVVENLRRDGWLYPFIMRNIKDIVKCANINLEISHGGGSDIKVVFEYLMDQGFIVVALVDTDRHSPLSKKNEKLNALISSVRNRDYQLAFTGAPPCREVENIIPFDLISTLPCAIRHDSNQHHTAISAAERSLQDPVKNRFWLYFDVKNGVSPEIISARTEDEQSWIREKISLAGLNASKEMIGGYGGRVVDQIIDSNEKAAKLREACRSKVWLIHFEEFFKEFTWVFASGRPNFT